VALAGNLAHEPGADQKPAQISRAMSSCSTGVSPPQLRISDAGGAGGADAEAPGRPVWEGENFSRALCPALVGGGDTRHFAEVDRSRS